MTGKVCLITGGNSGIGKATAMGLAKLNASVVIVSRDKDKGEATLIEMRAKSGNRNLDAMTADLSSQDSVRELAHDFTGRYKKLHVLFTYRLAKQLEGTGVTVNSLHPGVVRTGFGKDQGGLMSILVTVGRPFMISPERAARAAVYLATSPELEGVTGKFFSRGKEKRSSRESYDETSAERLWKVSEELTRLNA